jgi:hypothetical protein
MDRVSSIKDQIKKFSDKLNELDEVLSLIVYGSFSEASDHLPTKYSDVDLEIVVEDASFDNFIQNFKPLFEQNAGKVLIDTSVSHLQKIYVTYDFVDWQFHISRISDFDNIDKREMNYFPNGYTIVFDKSDSISNRIQNSIKPDIEVKIEDKLNKLNNAFWYFVQGTSPFIERGEHWFAAAGYWAWLFNSLCTLLRIHYEKEVKYNPMKHIETALPNEVIKRIEPLRNLEKQQDLKDKMNLIIDVFSEYIKLTYDKNTVVYDFEIENLVKKQVRQYLD